MSEEKSISSGQTDAATGSVVDARSTASDDTPATAAEMPAAATAKKSRASTSTKTTDSKTAADQSASTNTSKTVTKQATTAEGETAKGAKKSPTGSRGLRWPGVVALLLLVPVLATLGYGYWQLRLAQQTLASLSSQQASQHDRIQALQTQLGNTTSDLSQEQAARSALQQQQQALTAQLDDIATRLGRSSLAWRLAEIEYLLTLANHRLVFVQDVATAIQILESADQRLAQLADPGLLPVRQAIANELVALHAVAKVDISGAVMQLGSLADEVAQLPLVDRQRIESQAAPEQAATERTWRDIPRVVWENLKSLVQIRRHDQPLEPLLPAKESWYLTQNLQLKLEQARLALLQGKPAVFHQSLREADNWLVSYYDNTATPVSSVRDTISHLQALELSAQLPDISDSLRLLRDFMARQSISTTASTDQPQESNAQ